MTDAIVSIDPESRGGTDVPTGATCAMRSGRVIGRPPRAGGGSTRRRVEVLAGDLGGADGMARIVGGNAVQPGQRLLGRRKRQQPLALGQVGAPAGVLDQRGTAGGQVALGAVAEPAGTARDVGVLGHAELRLRALDEGPVVPQRARHAHRIHGGPAVAAQELLRAVDGQLDALRRARGQVENLQELAILVPVDVGEALDLPGHDGGEAITRRSRLGMPQIGDHRLPRLVPRQPAGRHVASRRADVGAEREEVSEAAEEVHVPRVALGQGQLGEDRVRVDEHPPRDARVLVAPEPRAARKVDEQIGVGAEALHGLAGRAVIGAVEVDEAPAVAEAEGLERVVDVARAVARILGPRVQHRVVDDLAGVLDVEDLVAERAQAEQVHQRAPGDPAEGIARDDAGDEDLHWAPVLRSPAALRRPSRARRATGRPTAARTCARRGRWCGATRRAGPAPSAGPRAARGCGRHRGWSRAGGR